MTLRRWLPWAGWVLAAVLLLPYGLAAYETARDDRADARARKAWPAQEVQIERALAVFVAPTDWAAAACTPSAVSPAADDYVSTRTRC